MITRSTGYRALLLALFALPAACLAQGTLSTQGFGYPGGQFSTRSLGTSGANAESDPFSATNPAALFNFGGSVLYFQAEPEYRTITNGSVSEHATIARYPLVTAAVPIGSSFFGGITLSNLLDRTFETSGRASQLVGGDVVASTNTFSSDGAIADVRLALAWSAASWLRLGAAGHVITGDNELRSVQAFDDAARFATLMDTQTVTYSGTAYSAGFDITAGRVATFSGSYRYGGPLSIKHADTTLRTGHVPGRIALGASFIGVRGAAFSVRTAKNMWTNMASLAETPQQISEGWDSSIGADVLGPRLLGIPLQLRAGARTRTLPFGVPPRGGTAGSDVKETSFSFGTGGVIGRGRASFDIAAIHANRSAASTPVKESAWTLSIGVGVRP